MYQGAGTRTFRYLQSNGRKDTDFRTVLHKYLGCYPASIVLRIKHSHHNKSETSCEPFVGPLGPGLSLPSPVNYEKKSVRTVKTSERFRSPKSEKVRRWTLAAEAVGVTQAYALA